MDNNIENWLTMVESQEIISAARLKFRCQEVFNDIPLSGRHVLEIGCGPGLFCLWAALHGAAHVVGLEPEVEGCTPGSSQIFRRQIQMTTSSNVVCVPKRLQDYNPEGEKFDVVISYNSIEHFDEDAVISLHKSETSQRVYIELFRKVASFMQPNGVIVIYNVGRNNIWPHLLRGWSPIAPTIEWNKHHDPKLWHHLLDASGFTNIQASWQRFYTLRHFGMLASNRLSAYLLSPVFRLQATYSG